MLVSHGALQPGQLVGKLITSLVESKSWLFVPSISCDASASSGTESCTEYIPTYHLLLSSSPVMPPLLLGQSPAQNTSQHITCYCLPLLRCLHFFWDRVLHRIHPNIYHLLLSSSPAMPPLLLGQSPAQNTSQHITCPNYFLPLLRFCWCVCE